ncbi:hypothetical protein [Bradyrhizobium diazoefficiens]|uniref:Peptidase C39-like domain-containing protein n=1 Tax=Bradyrhizobium diazoefficiens TaxID=1355477 RepID=A0A809Z862_9BRAD|nr:hypothetical protein [Bradyrhizobium diazoefficiens]WLA70021.1 hypothetical protein QIH77_24245 [Bradyrhizobium diazoefficiens]BCE22380.1 hypothetical protein XF1B_50610 [Bradyrhizobium diazoefficiens]BCE48644.1 hypothetical protein XF4B_49930 [Bradyrhizobium diazoefficiens]BCE92159.1 hypothetical protein XF10B_49570 [Bradyrhizobium diazoefficiens]BCF27086.1 hypothetical protein XF14B_50380 [Bradyrhizobium diazoefficiens]
MPLFDVTDWVPGTYCVPTALAAITGKKIPDVIEAINKQAILLGMKTFTQFEGIPPKCWLQTLPSLGIGDRADTGHQGLTIDELFRASASPSPMLVLTSHIEMGMGHVFAAHGDFVVDTYTDGKVTNFSEVPEDMKGFKVRAEIY